jgi:hypothetical protein
VLCNSIADAESTVVGPEITPASGAAFTDTVIVAVLLQPADEPVTV